MADADELLPQVLNLRDDLLNKSSDKEDQLTSKISVLVPNKKHLDRAASCVIKAGRKASDIDQVAIFAAASEEFSLRNINCSIDKSFERFSELVKVAREEYDIKSIRGYISCVLGCPYSGEVSPDQVARVTERMLNLEVDEISLGDTTGIGSINKTIDMMKAVNNVMNKTTTATTQNNINNSICSVAVHFHDTYGQALPNIYAALLSEGGIDAIDCSVAGLGGCPYAKGASGNVATEDVLRMLNGLGIETGGVDMDLLLKADDYIGGVLNHHTKSKTAAALLTAHD